MRSATRCGCRTDLPPRASAAIGGISWRGRAGSRMTRQSLRRACSPPTAATSRRSSPRSSRPGQSPRRSIAGCRRCAASTACSYCSALSRTIRRNAFRRRNSPDTCRRICRRRRSARFSTRLIRKPRWDCATAPCSRHCTRPDCACPSWWGSHWLKSVSTWASFAFWAKATRSDWSPWAKKPSTGSSAI